MINYYKNTTRIGFHIELVCNKKYPKTKIKTYEGRIHTHFHIDRMPEEGSHSICSSAILIDSVFKIVKSFS